MNQNKEVIKYVCNPKYLEEGETFEEGMRRIAYHLKDDEKHYNKILPILTEQRFCPGGRIQASAGAARNTTAFNCYVSDTIEDSMSGIMLRLADAAATMRLGGGDGFDFSTLRPKNAPIKSLGSFSSGPLSFMAMWDTMCDTIKSAGHRRGAMMGCLRVDHPDIEEFITCKTGGVLTNFNISVLVTDEFMKAVKNDQEFELKFDGVVYRTVSARNLWNKIMRHTWDHAEPGVLFIDKINKKNNLYYCETIAATNPCGEQPLPPNGACLLGSFNLVKYCHYERTENDVNLVFDWEQFKADIPEIHRMMDNVIDRTTYPLEAQAQEAMNKRRMGLGIMGLANAMEFFNYEYGSSESLQFMTDIMAVLRDETYRASANLAKEKGSFPLYDEEKYLNGQFIQTLSDDVINLIRNNGIRNSHLLSIAPTGTISLFAGNVSGGIEPPFSLEYIRKVYMPDGTQKEYIVQDYAYAEWGIKGKTSQNLSAEDHIKVLNIASKYVDSACSKTCNVGDEVTFDEFKELYMMAYDGDASGCTTFRPSGFLKGVLTEKPKEEISEGATCTIDPETGERSCSD